MHITFWKTTPWKLKVKIKRKKKVKEYEERYVEMKVFVCYKKKSKIVNGMFMPKKFVYYQGLLMGCKKDD